MAKRNLKAGDVETVYLDPIGHTEAICDMELSEPDPTFRDPTGVYERWRGRITVVHETGRRYSFEVGDEVSFSVDTES